MAHVVDHVVGHEVGHEVDLVVEDHVDEDGEVAEVRDENEEIRGDDRMGQVEQDPFQVRVFQDSAHILVSCLGSKVHHLDLERHKREQLVPAMDLQF